MSGSSRIRAKAGAQQADWLSLVEPRGQFLTLPILRQSFPQGLSPVPVDTRREVRERARALDPQDPGSTTAWLEWLLTDLLAWGERLRVGPQVPDQLAFTVAEHGVRLRPEYALLDKDGRARVLVERYAPGTRLDARIPGDRWAATPIDRAGVLCRALAVPLALVTNGQHITLVYAPQDKVGGHATWDTSLFAEGAEATLLDAFVELLGARSFFAKAPDSQLDALLARSADAQAELTTTLGLQVRRAVELVVASLSRANLEAHGEPLKGIAPHRVYEAASTVVMRLVFLLYAEERHLLPLGEQVYDDNYAISTILDELQSESDLSGDEPLELRSDAWQRILATTRAVYAGVSHDRLRMPAYDGSLFDPDRFPFLEGRTDDEPWQSHPSSPMRVDDLTIREILRALQVISSSEGGVTEARRLSFRALGVEQIGHVYEGLLDHSALRADTVILGLIGKAGTEPEATLDALEEAAQAGTQSLTDFVVELTGRTSKQVSKLLTAPIDDQARRGLLTACDNDTALVARLEPFAHLLRDDLRGLPTVFIPGTIYVTETSHRRDTGTEYTPRELAEEIVKYTLEPLVYSPGPQDGAAPGEWKLKSPEEILSLTVCDPAVGSGAILVAACRYLADRLVEARLERDETPEGYVYDASVPAEADELIIQARRDVADRCLFGVDRDPMAVEMAKLSLWLTTLSRERPFTFVDHAIQTGDSLLGITSLDQLYALHLDPERGCQINSDLFIDLNAAVKPMVDAALNARRQLELLPGTTVRDIGRKAELNRQATAGLQEAGIIADFIIGAALASHGNEHQFEQLIQSGYDRIDATLKISGKARADGIAELEALASELINRGRPAVSPVRRCLHWPLAFPEVFASGGFSAFVGNPPFLGGRRISGRNGSDVRDYLVRWIAGGKSGSADLVAYFFLRASCLSRSFGLLATNSISQGETREVGLDQITAAGRTIHLATKSRPWPGSASLEVAMVWITRDSWGGAFVLDGQEVSGISPYLSVPARVRGLPFRLAANRELAFQGSNVLGMGFTISEEEAEYLLLQHPEWDRVLFPFINGKDLNASPVLAGSRWIINFHDWDESRARMYPELFARVERDVLPERQTVTYNAAAKAQWWLYLARAKGLYEKLTLLDECFALALTSNLILPARVPARQVFSHALGIWASDDASLFSSLSSNFHWHWAARYASTMRNDIRYNPPDVFETFPLPQSTGVLRRLGERLHIERQELQLKWDLGMTKLYNRVHDADDTDTQIWALRDLHRDIDLGVREAYGWLDLDLEHGFHSTPQGVRWSFSERAQVEVLDRLLELNHARHAQEAGDRDEAPKKTGRKARRARRTAGNGDQMTMELQ